MNAVYRFCNCLQYSISISKAAAFTPEAKGASPEQSPIVTGVPPMIFPQKHGRDGWFGKRREHLWNNSL